MKFQNSLDALQWLINHRLGGTTQASKADRLQHRYDAPMVTAADLSKCLETLPQSQQRALIKFALSGTKTRFLKTSLARFKQACSDRGYLTETHGNTLPQAA